MAAQLDNDKRLTKDYLKKLLRKEFKLYYSTPYLNDVLYLHYKGFDKIENLDEFTGLKVIYLEGNGLGQICGNQNFFYNYIVGLEPLVNLKCLYLQENLIKKIEGLNFLKELVILNLTDNCIEKIEGLENCTKLQTLQIKRNRIGTNGISDLNGVLNLPNLSVLDVSDNKIADPDVVSLIFENMPALSVLYFQNNSATKEIQHYRKKLIYQLKQLKYLDDRPVFPEERRFAEAFALGGLDLERQERANFKKEQEDQHMKNHLAFRAMMNQYREEGQQLQQQQAQMNQEQLPQPQPQPEQLQPSFQEVELQEEVPSDNDSSQTLTHLSTYNSQSQKQSESEKELSKSESKQSLQSQEIEIKQINFENSSGVLEDGKTFCTQKDFNGHLINNLDELD